MRNESFNPDEYDDPTNPPPGYMAIECPDCSLNYMKPSAAPKMSLGPISGFATPAHRSASLCTACRGRTWLWAPLPQVLPNLGPKGDAGDASHEEG